MLIAVTGASGRTGSHVVTGLLQAGHTVRAVVRSEQKGAPLRTRGAEVTLADLTIDDSATWLAGTDALIHTAAASDPSPGAADAVDRDATVALVAAAQRSGVQRVVQVSSMYADRPEAGPTFLHDVLRAKAVSDAALADSGLVWTIVRPGGLVDDDPTGKIEAGRRLDSGRISRADLAAVCIACLDEPATERFAFDVTSGVRNVPQALAELPG
ncbi:MAG: SDR family oxidoreductase [Propionibacteriaceae bacterium]